MDLLEGSFYPLEDDRNRKAFNPHRGWRKTDFLMRHDLSSRGAGGRLTSFTIISFKNFHG